MPPERQARSRGGRASAAAIHGIREGWEGGACREGEVEGSREGSWEGSLLYAVEECRVRGRDEQRGRGPGGVERKGGLEEEGRAGGGEGRNGKREIRAGAVRSAEGGERQGKSDDGSRGRQRKGITSGGN